MKKNCLDLGHFTKKFFPFFISGHNKSLPMVSDLTSVGFDIKRCSLRSAGSLPEGMPTITGSGGCNERDDMSLYGTPKEEIPPYLEDEEDARKPGWVRNQLQNIFQPTDNKLAMKLFGSKKAVIQERVRQKAAGHWIIHPCSSFRYKSLFRILAKWVNV